MNDIINKLFVGFDGLSLIDPGSYPPYNLRKVGENTHIIEIALAGFDRKNIDIEVQEGGLVVRGRSRQNSPETYLHKGISDKPFERKFTLASSVKVTGAELTNGLLSITLERVLPEGSKARKVEIK